jgi:hypothetical protein
MKARAFMGVVVCALVMATGGCGGGRDLGDAGPNPNDKRAVALLCLRDEKGLDARLSGEKSIAVDGPSGPRIDFFVSSGEAEGQQFQGKAQNAEQVGAALLYVNRGSDGLLQPIEECLDEQ